MLWTTLNHNNSSIPVKEAGVTACSSAPAGTESFSVRSRGRHTGTSHPWHQLPARELTKVRLRKIVSCIPGVGAGHGTANVPVSGGGSCPATSISQLFGCSCPAPCLSFPAKSSARRAAHGSPLILLQPEEEKAARGPYKCLQISEGWVSGGWGQALFSGAQ